ncbi:hypothetical protein GCM10022243_34010 [Saccharothrix violaceirubra]|uniref:Uncharacterized protein n=1 Tax=Saccharothrix violaceirubra TaxID=413306 RepID=A0A7W7WWJ8_9PSEU|nr:hypothetical protein [Saccharothrix violaceirubra]MBB4966454.1 hypothetical protein [Saccharothrix violaceirubra]
MDRRELLKTALGTGAGAVVACVMPDVGGTPGLPELISGPTAHYRRMESTVSSADLFPVVRAHLCPVTTLVRTRMDNHAGHAALDAGGTIEVVVPAAGYRDALPPEHHRDYDTLLARATTVTRLDHHASDPTAHMDASLRMLDQADALLAVWDGQPARGYGGTADVVRAAFTRDIPVTVVWPTGSTR